MLYFSSDLNPILQAANASLEFRRVSVDNAERHVLLRDFFLPNRRISMTDDEVLIAVHIPIPSSSSKSFLRSYKQARRRDDSSGIVSAGLHVKLEQVKNDDNDGEWRIISACFSFGGMASITTMAQQTQKELIGQVWKKTTINKACELMLAEFPLNEFTPGGQSEYRRTLLQSFLFKFYLYVCSELRQTLVEQKHMSAAHIYRRPVSHGQQTIPERPLNHRVVGSPLPHRSAYVQTTGEAKYTNDLPSLLNTLHAALVLSTQPNARIKNIYIEAAQRLPGFVSFISYTDVPGSNMTGIIVQDEEVFASCFVPCVGTIIGLVVCDAEQTANTAANLIQIDYELLAPVIVTIDDAIQYESYLGDEQCIRKGDPNQALSEAEHTLEETLLIGGQEHFYLETNCCMAIPSNDDEELTLYSATQDPNKIQELVALAIGRKANHIKCLVKRIGGSFGGKDSRSVLPSIAVAVAAVKLGRPVRLNMERDVDMSVTGQRHPFKISYKVGFTNKGLFSALDIRLWSNAGCSFDQSMPILQKAMLHIDNTYQFHNVEIRGRLCKTHLPSNTAFRGFGCPQAIFACETIVEHVAAYLKLDSLIVRRLNLYQEGDLTHFGQALEHWHVPRILDELTQSSNFIWRQQTVDEFNRLNTYRKRGLSILPTKLGISFMAKYLNQAGALVHIYKDGSVLVTHGGVEMGQGLHTKMVSVAAEVLGCNVEQIHVSETSTDKVPNVSATGASVSSDLYGKAVQHACEQIRERLNTLLVKDDSNLQWEYLIKKAYYERIDLSAHGFYVTPEPLGEDLNKNRAHFSYFTQGAAVAEVELDTLTGDWHLLRVDILMWFILYYCLPKTK
ncbi:unnamed protein product [Rotaria sp. Silwood1]|nr:unnamed protein product [Rotaria sp. Silwood1]